MARPESLERGKKFRVGNRPRHVRIGRRPFIFHINREAREVGVNGRDDSRRKRVFFDSVKRLDNTQHRSRRPRRRAMPRRVDRLEPQPDRNLLRDLDAEHDIFAAYTPGAALVN